MILHQNLLWEIEPEMVTDYKVLQSLPLRNLVFFISLGHKGRRNLRRSLIPGAAHADQAFFELHCGSLQE
jgi:hypothetical protein